MEAIKIILSVIGGIVGVILAIVLIIVGIQCGINFITYYTDKSMCTAYVNGKLVFNGRCHFISIHSIEPYAGSKKLIIFNDIVGLRPRNVYVSTDIEVGE